MSDQQPHVIEALRKARLQLEQLKRNNRGLLERSSEPIAIVGRACHFPGGVDSPEGNATGVFAGVMTQGYGVLSEEIEGYRLTGMTSSVASGRVSYVLGLDRSRSAYA